MVATTCIDLAAVIHTELQPTQEVTAYELGIDPGDPSHLLVAAGEGLVLHGSTQPDHRPTPRLYRTETWNNIEKKRTILINIPIVGFGSLQGIYMSIVK